jgi:hypothetical protein
LGINGKSISRPKKVPAIFKADEILPTDSKCLFWKYIIWWKLIRDEISHHYSICVYGIYNWANSNVQLLFETLDLKSIYTSINSIDQFSLLWFYYTIDF